jgi:hypothetical protein
VACYDRSDIGTPFATIYRLPTRDSAPFDIGYAFDGKPHDNLPDVECTLINGKLFIAEAGMEVDKQQDRQQAKAETARRLARRRRGSTGLERCAVSVYMESLPEVRKVECNDLWDDGLSGSESRKVDNNMSEKVEWSGREVRGSSARPVSMVCASLDSDCGIFIIH